MSAMRMETEIAAAVGGWLRIVVGSKAVRGEGGDVWGGWRVYSVGRGL